LTWAEGRFCEKLVTATGANSGGQEPGDAYVAHMAKPSSKEGFRVDGIADDSAIGKRRTLKLHESCISDAGFVVRF